MFSRIAYTFDLPDYSPRELALIFMKYLTRHGWSIRETSLDEIAEVFAQVPPTMRKHFNGAASLLPVAPFGRGRPKC